MRTFTDKEIEAAGNAFQFLMYDRNKKKCQSKTAEKYIRSMLEDGLRLDEIFNPINYARYLVYLKTNTANEKESAEDFIDKMKQLYIDVNKLEDDWEIPTEAQMLMVRYLQKFYGTFKDAGVVTSGNNFITIRNAVVRYGLQTVMSEELISKFLDGNNPNGLAYYAKWLLESPDEELIARASEPTEEQTAKENLRNYTEEYPETAESEEETANDGAAEQETSGDAEEIEGTRIVDEKEISRTLEGEPEAVAKVTTMGVSETPEADDGEGPAEEAEEAKDDGQTPPADETFFDAASLAETEEETHEAIFIGRDPQTYKKECILSIMVKYTPDQLKEISRFADIEGEHSLENIAEALAEGRYSVKDESDAAMNIHDTMNMDLSINWEDSMRQQGIEPDQNLRMNSDPLVERWDMRDAATRKLQKLKKLVLSSGNNAMDDEDIREIFRDLESKYEADKEKDN